MEQQDQEMNSGTSIIELSSSSGDSESEVDEAEVTSLLYDWDAAPEVYTLYHSDTSFNAYCKPYIDLLIEYGEQCTAKYRELNQGEQPSVEMFWNFVFQKTIPPTGWTANWKLVNPDRRGWPLQHHTRALVQVESVTFVGLNPPKLDLQPVAVDGGSLEGVALPDISEISVWQLHPISLETEEGEVAVPHSPRKILELARTFFEMLHPLSNNDDGMEDFFGVTFYERMKLFYYMENPVPSSRVVSMEDRGKIIIAIKEYHKLKNGLLDVSNSLDEEESIDEDLAEVGDLDGPSKFIVLQMKLQRHSLELSTLLNPTFRPLVCLLSRKTLDPSFQNYATILVVKEATLDDMKNISQQLEDLYGERGTSNFRISNDLEEALQNCPVGCKIYVASGNYSTSGLYRLGCGGSLLGIPIGGKDVTITATDNVGDIWLSVKAEPEEPVVIKNVNFVVNTKEADACIKTGVYVHAGVTTFENVIIRDLNLQASTFVPAKSEETGSNSTITLNYCNFEIVRNIIELE